MTKPRGAWGRSAARAWPLAAAGGLIVGAWIAVTPVTAGADTLTFNCTGGAQSWTVPAGVTSATFDVLGAGGGNGNFGEVTQVAIPGKGGEAKATISVTPGTVITINVGCHGQVGTSGDGSTPGSAVGGAGGFGDGNGGPGGLGTSGAGGGGGGGSSVVQAGIRVVVGGGGGGSAPSGLTTAGAGGDGGGATGTAGQNGFTGGNGGGGGTSTGPGTGGCGPTCAGVGPTGGPGGNITGVGVESGAGGGGGLFGGGGGAPAASESAGGGGGSGACPAGCLVFQNGVQTGDGLVTITFSATPTPVVVAPRFTG